MPEIDKWSRWLLETRLAGDEKLTEHGLGGVRQLGHHHVSGPVAAFCETRGLLGLAGRLVLPNGTAKQMRH